MGTAIERRELKLVETAGGAPRSRRAAVLAVAAGLAAAAALATALGADRARAPLDARRHVAETLDLALAEGNRSPDVVVRLRLLRAELGRRPLDSQSRARYAALLLAMAQSLEDTRAAAFHARAAARLAPVTFPVVELAALILGRSGDIDGALEWVRAAFEFDPAQATGLLLQLEDTFAGRRSSEILGDTPGAWIAWSRTLAAEGRDDEAAALLERAIARWPGDPGLLLTLTRRAARAGDWPAVGRLLETVGTIPDGSDDRAVLEMLGLRARWHAEYDRREAARDDLARLLASAGNAPPLLVLAGDTQLRLGDTGAARRSWHRALFGLSGNSEAMRVSILVRLAELEDREGRASTALRHWRAVLEIDPGHVRARRRVAELTGFET